jgi:inosine/xanthosine triphosphatase
VLREGIRVLEEVSVNPSGRLHIVVASTNPVKIRAALGGFQDAFPERVFRVSSLDVPSGVADQPRTDAETLRGAEARAARAMVASPTADIWVGIEGGVADIDERLAAYAWVVVRSRDRTGKARTGTFFLPEAVARLVRDGLELGEADDRVFGCTDSKREGGAVGLLTGGAIDRAALYRHAVTLALIPFRNAALYD